jgi:hypothetical protein
MKLLFLLVCCPIAGCAGKDPTEDRCNIVRSFSSEPLGYDFMTADPVPVSISDDGLERLLTLAPSEARKYRSFCGSLKSNGLFILTPNEPLPRESFTFRRENGDWKFVRTEEIFYLQ